VYVEEKMGSKYVEGRSIEFTIFLLFILTRRQHWAGGERSLISTIAWLF